MSRQDYIFDIGELSRQTGMPITVSHPQEEKMRKLIDTLRADAQNAERIACDLSPYLRDDPKATAIERFVWALAVGQLHIIEWILRGDRR